MQWGNARGWSRLQEIIWNFSLLLGTRVVMARAANLTVVSVNHGAVPFLCSRWLSLGSNPASGTEVFRFPRSCSRHVRGGCGTVARAGGEAGRDSGQRGPREVVQAWPLLRADPAGMNCRGVLSASVMGLQGWTRSPLLLCGCLSPAPCWASWQIFGDLEGAV